MLQEEANVIELVVETMFLASVDTDEDRVYAGQQREPRMRKGTLSTVISFGPWIFER